MKWQIRKFRNDWLVYRKKVNPMCFNIPFSWEFGTFEEAHDFVSLRITQEGLIHYNGLQAKS